MRGKKPRQHHIWQQYLRAWSVDGAVYCLQEGRIFHAGTTVLGIEKDFYKLPPLTDADLKLLAFLLDLDNAPPIVRMYLDTVLRNILGPMLFARQNRDRLYVSKADELLDVHNTNAIDNHHTRIEGTCISLLERSLAGDLNWYDNGKECLDFCQFLIAQQMRTRGVKERVISKLLERWGGAADVSRIWDILAIKLSFVGGLNIFRSRQRYRLISIRNDTPMPFITSDQPVIHLHGNGETLPEVTSLYYPISPRLALYLGEPGAVSDMPIEAMTPETVAYLNLRMAKASHSQVYAHTLKPLEAVRNCLRNGA